MSTFDVKDLCLRFCGPPDPARSNVRNAREREASKECLDTIYADNIAIYATGGAPTMQAALTPLMAALCTVKVVYTEDREAEAQAENLNQEADHERWR